jgi:hypothetical protein
MWLLAGSSRWKNPPPKICGVSSGNLSGTFHEHYAPGIGGSSDKLGALALDEHVAHLVRPALEYFKGDPHFDGFGFSTTAFRGLQIMGYAFTIDENGSAVPMRSF